jgi:hypothetical protein
MCKYLSLVLLVCLVGCAGVSAPNYIQAEHPYKRTVYGSFEEVLDAVRQGLTQEGWAITKETHPSLYERNALYSEDDKEHVLIFTDLKRSNRFVYAGISHLNVYVHKTTEGVELDVRYGGVTNLHFKKVQRYRNDKLVDKFLNSVEQKLLLKKT